MNRRRWVPWLVLAYVIVIGVMCYHIYNDSLPSLPRTVVVTETGDLDKLQYMVVLDRLSGEEFLVLFKGEHFEVIQRGAWKAPVEPPAPIIDPKSIKEF